jgi:hypothetical protein
MVSFLLCMHPLTAAPAGDRVAGLHYPVDTPLPEHPLQDSDGRPLEVIPFQTHRARNAILVCAQVNGEHIQMLVDTGASNSIISAETLGWGQARLKQAEFSRQGPGINFQGTWENADVLFGDTLWKNRPIVVMDFRAVREIFGPDVSGILGQDILTEFASVEIDFNRQELRLRNP